MNNSGSVVAVVAVVGQESHPLIDVMKYAICLILKFVNIRYLPGVLATGKFMSFFILLIVLCYSMFSIVLIQPPSSDIVANVFYHLKLVNITIRRELTILINVKF